MQVLLILGIVFAIGAVTFALQNSIPVTVVFAFWHYDSSLAVVLLVALGLGALIAGLVSTPPSRKPGGRQGGPRTPRTRTRIRDGTENPCSCAGSGGSRAVRRVEVADDGIRRKEVKLMLMSGPRSALPQLPFSVRRPSPVAALYSEIGNLENSGSLFHADFRGIFVV